MVQCDAYTSNPRYILRVVCLVVHFCIAVIISVFVFKCPRHQFKNQMYFVKAYDFPQYARVSPFYDKGVACNSTMTCFRNGVPWDDGYAIPNMYWNPYVLLFVLEWITVTMALYYLRVDMHYKQNGHEGLNLFLYWMCMFVNGAAATVYIIYFFGTPLQTNGLEFVLVSFAFVVSTLVVAFYETWLDRWIKSFADPLTNCVKAQV